MIGGWTPYLPSLATSPFRDTTLPGRQVGEGVSPTLDVIPIIVCGLGASKQIWPLTNLERSREWALEAAGQLDVSGVAWFVGRLASVHRATAQKR